jgi:hypothetical protein
VDAPVALDDLQHSVINRRLREALGHCMASPHSGIIALHPGGDDWRLHWLAGPTARLAGRVGAGYDFAASLEVLAAEYARNPKAMVPGLAGVGVLTTFPGGADGLAGFAAVVAGDRIHAVRWAAGATTPTWRICGVDGDFAAGLVALLRALQKQEVA